jgi:hypothetical protein
MNRVAPGKLDGRADELAPPVVVLLPHAQDRPLVRSALTLAHGLGTRVRAYAFHTPGDHLPGRVRSGLYGSRLRSEADRAIQHLVDSAVAGAHVPVRRLPDTPEEQTGEMERVQALGREAVLIVGLVPDGAKPEPERLRPMVETHQGPVVVLFDRVAPFSEVLAVTPPEDSYARDVFARLAYGLERACPVFWRHNVVRIDELELAAADATAEQLTLVAAPAPGDLGPLEQLEEPHSFGPGPLAVLFPKDPGRADLVAKLLEA